MTGKVRKAHSPARAIGVRRRPGESVEAFRARVRPELRQHERKVRRRTLGLDAPPVEVRR